MMSDNNDNKDEDSDSGLVEDMFDVLPDENTLALEDYNDLDLDLSENNFGAITNSSTSDYSDLLELDEEDECSEVLPDTLQAHTVNDNGSIIQDKNEHTSEKEESKRKILIAKPPLIRPNDGDKECDVRNGGKLVSFSKEQARQWRRKRILKSKEKNTNVTEKNFPTKLQPLLPLPKELKPATCKPKETITKEKVKAEDKLSNPLLGGEKMSTRTKRGIDTQITDFRRINMHK